MSAGRFLLRLVTGIALVLILGPILVIFLFAFSAADT